MGGPLSGLAGWVTDVIQSLGYAGVAFLVALENLFPPLPSELILPLSGFLVSQGRFTFIAVLAAATAGSVAGALVLYGLGRWLSARRVRALVQRYGRYFLMSEADLDRATGWFARHGAAAVLIGRWVPGVRSLISVPAGIERLPLWKFIVFTTIGSGIWNGTLIGLGWALGARWTLVRDYAQRLEYVVLAVLAAAVAWFVFRRWKSRQTQR